MKCPSYGISLSFPRTPFSSLGVGYVVYLGNCAMKIHMESHGLVTGKQTSACGAAPAISNISITTDITAIIFGHIILKVRRK